MTGPATFLDLAKAITPKETTVLPPDKQAAFEHWLQKNNVTDLDHPDSHYDYRGAFLAGVNPASNGHYPDTFKQHGHPTFSVESKYSAGPHDGGRWEGETFLPPTSADSASMSARMRLELLAKKGTP